MNRKVARRIDKAMEEYGSPLMIATLIALEWSPKSYWCDIYNDYQNTPCDHDSCFGT